MIAEKICGKFSGSEKKTETVVIEWFERDKKILRKISSSGEEVGIRTEETLNQNDIIYEDDERIIYIDIAPCDLVSVSVSDMKEMGRLCFELGNRHLSLSIDEHTVKCPYDVPTFEYLKRLGFSAEKVHEKFEGYIECRAHAHTNTHSHSGSHDGEHHHGHHHEHEH